MPLEYQVDHVRRLVVATIHGTFTRADAFQYQQEVWSQQGVSGYDELVVVMGATRFDSPSADRVRSLADAAAEMDDKLSRAKLAIVAPTDTGYGFARMYQSFREMMQHSTKDVAVFRTMEEALSFLNVQGPLDIPPRKST